MRRLLSFASIGLVVAGAVATDVAMQTQRPEPAWTTEPFLDQFSKPPALPPVAAPADDATPRVLPIARIVDIMRVINSDEGVRGRLANALSQQPKGDTAWERARAARVGAQAKPVVLVTRSEELP